MIFTILFTNKILVGLPQGKPTMIFSSLITHTPLIRNNSINHFLNILCQFS